MTATIAQVFDGLADATFALAQVRGQIRASLTPQINRSSAA